MAAFLAVSAVSGAQTAPQLLPYTAKLVAGGGTQTTAKGATCPTSGNVATDNYGDGCLATELVFSSTGSTSTKPLGARYAVADANGVIYFTDATAGLVRRIDPITNIVTAFAGGASASPSSGATCGAYASTDSRGDGCLSTAVHLTYPMGLVIAPNGDLIFTDVGQYDVRRVAAVGGVLPATGGIISNIAGYTAGGATFGYQVSNGTTTVNAATQSYLDAPYNVAIDSQGDIIVAEEFKNAILAINPGTTATTVAGVTVAPGAIIKIAGSSTASGYSGTPYCPNGTSGTFGCNFNPFTEGASANLTYLDSPYAVAVDPSGNVYIANEFNTVVPKVSTAGVLTTYAGNQSMGAKTTARGVAPFAMGSDFGIVADRYSNLYITDALAGVVWRVDGAGKYQYVVAGGASTTCAAATDAYGDGCPATQAIFGSTYNTTSAGNPYATAASPGIYGITMDAAGNLYVGDTVTNLVREISNGTQFGQVGSAVTHTLDIHFAAGDSPVPGAYVFTSSGFTLGTATCTVNSDTTQDCLLPVTASAANSQNLGPFSAMLLVSSTNGGNNAFTLTGTHVQTPVTRTSVGVFASTPCTGTTTYSTSTPLTLTATISSTGSPTGTVQFYANNVAIGPPVAVSIGSASLQYTFSTPAKYTITATYSGDSYFNGSTGTSGTAITTSNPTFSGTVVETPANGSVVQGQTAAYSFTLAQSVYTGTLTFGVSGLPANTSVSFSPNSISATGCSTSNIVTMTITTQLALQKQAGFGGNGPWKLGSMLAAVSLAALLAVRRRRSRGAWSNVAIVLALFVVSASLVACGKSTQTGVSTPTGTYPLSIKITGSDGSTATVPTSLTVTAYVDPYH